MTSEEIEEIIARHADGPGSIMTMLEDIQDRCHYLPEEALRIVARRTGRSLVDIYGVATFYKAFSLKPRGKHLISCCLGTACHVRGGQAIAEEFQRQLHVGAGETTADNEITFETVNCLGACALGPVVVSDGHYSTNVNRREVQRIIQRTKDGQYGSDQDSTQDALPLEVFCPHCRQSLMDDNNRIDGHPSVLISVGTGNRDGDRVRLSSLYGKFAKVFEDDLPREAVVEFFCPHCDARLQGANRCLQCGAPMADLKANGNSAVISVCTRKECGGHMLDLNRTTIY